MGCVLSLVRKDADLQELYNLEKMLGEGVEGEVWLATSKKTGAKAAIKLIPRGDDLGLGPEKVRREIQLQAQLSHVNIVELKQVVLTPRHLGIVMSYESGGDLHVFCNKYKVDEMAARYFFIQIIAALDYCHRHNIAHRDLKLSNFLLTGDDPPRLKLTDFGCSNSWVKKSPSAKIGRFKTFAGTPAYMAPQVLESAFYPTNTYSAVEADVWACGILLCHIFFGRHTPFWLEPNAFRSEGATALERIRAMKGARGGWARSDPYIEERAAGLSPELRDLLDAIFVGDEDERITIEGIKQHPWFKGELSPKLQASIDAMREEQRQRDKLARAAVSTAAARHDLVDEYTGSFATIDEMVRVATTWRRMPGDDHVVILDMAHLDIDPLTSSTASSIASTPTAASASAAAALGARAGSGSLSAGELFGGGSAKDRSAAAGDAAAGAEGAPASPAAAAAGSMVRTLSLKHHQGGLVTATYSLERSAHGGGEFGGGAAAAPAGDGSRRSRPGSRGGSAHGGVALYEGSAHGGRELFKAAEEATASTREEKSWHAGVRYAPGADRSVRNGGASAAPQLAALEEH